jgi:hypothetical protein
MAVIRLEVRRDPANVPLIRLVASAVARRAGVDDGSIDEIKLAVGEACGLAVVSGGSGMGTSAAGTSDPGTSDPGTSDHAAAGAGARPLAVEFDDTDGLSIVVRSPVDLEHRSPDDGAGLVPDGLDIIRGLLDQVSVTTDVDGSVVTMSWPVAATFDHPGQAV